MADVTPERPTVCDRCQTPLAERAATHEILVGGERFDIENVPLLECPRCGERWISAETQEVLDRIVRENQA
jgi:YgiT-type zinc finger domain-containing protein